MSATLQLERAALSVSPSGLAWSGYLFFFFFFYSPSCIFISLEVRPVFRRIAAALDMHTALTHALLRWRIRV